MKFTTVTAKRISLGSCQLDIAFTFELSAMFTPWNLLL